MLLSILMPSNRDLAQSKRSIETALAFCERQDAQLIVSDNSRDPLKRQMLEGLSPRLTYLVPHEDGLEANLVNLYDAATTEFILMMGDDDEIFVSPKDQPIDLAHVDPSHVGVRPLIAVANSEGRVIRIKDFGITDETPGARVMTYNAKAGGDNAAYYSIFRRKPFVDLHRFFFAHHPLKGGYCDWSLAAVMFASGKMAYDPGTIFKYNHHRWDTKEKITDQRQSMYEAVGLPADSQKFGLLLLYLDTVILASRGGSLLDEAGKEDLARQAGTPILGGFCRKVADAPADYPPGTIELCRLMGAAKEPAEQLELAISCADEIKPGLALRYRAFHDVAMKNN